jgi:predicted nucleotidyltransferase
LHDDGNAAMVDRGLILTILQKHRADLFAFGVKSLAVFGSVARNEADTESDIDILVTLRHTPVTFDAYMDLKIYLEDLLENSVDLVIADSLNSRVKSYIQQDAVYVAGF